jgi:hypothetical protein
MNILYASKTPLAGVCELMARCVNQYLKAEGHSARVLNRGPGKHKWYCRDKSLVPHYSIEESKHVADCLRWADVIHCMANVGVRSPYFLRHGGPALLKTKRWVFQWHGAQIWPFTAVFFPEDYPHVRWIHIGQGWVQTQSDWFQPFFEKHGARVVPNLISIDDPLHVPLSWDERKDRIGYAPSTRGEGVNRKGIPLTTNSMVGFRHDIIHGVRFEECLRRKRICRLGIDEVVTPMYHRSGLEFLSQGTPCICSTTAKTDRVLMEATGCDAVPFINSTPGTLRQKIVWYWKELDDAERQEMGLQARAWMVEYYHPNMLIRKHLEVY